MDDIVDTTTTLEEIVREYGFVNEEETYGNTGVAKSHIDCSSLVIDRVLLGDINNIYDERIAPPINILSLSPATAMALYDKLDINDTNYENIQTRRALYLIGRGCTLDYDAASKLYTIRDGTSKIEIDRQKIIKVENLKDRPESEETETEKNEDTSSEGTATNNSKSGDKETSEFVAGDERVEGYKYREAESFVSKAGDLKR